MKVEGPGSSSRTGKVKGKEKKGGSTGSTSFSSMVESEAQEVAGGFTSNLVSKVDSLLTVQAAEDPTERAARRKMHQRGEAILETLDNIRERLLTGTLTVGDVIAVADSVATHRQKIQDPKLTAILDEIDLRAQVELAKVRVAMRYLDQDDLQQQD